MAAHGLQIRYLASPKILLMFLLTVSDAPGAACGWTR